MANIRIDLNHAPLDGETITFKAPCNASDILGLIVYYPNENSEIVSSEFTLNDANMGDIGVVDNIFSEGAIVKVILDTDTNNAYVQNPDTNTYIEGKFEELKVYIDAVASGKADASLAGRVETAEGEIDTLQSEFGAVEAKAAANEDAIGILNTTVATKAAQDDLTAVSDRVVTLETWHSNFVEVSEDEINALFSQP